MVLFNIKDDVTSYLTRDKLKYAFTKQVQHSYDLERR